MKLPEFPGVLGVIRNVKEITYNQALYDQRAEKKNYSKFKSLNDLFLSGNTFKMG